MEPVPVAESVGTGPSHGFFSVLPSGALAYRTGAALSAGWPLTSLDRQGKRLSQIGDPAFYSDVAMSPDGTSVVAAREEGANQPDIWLIELSIGGIRGDEPSRLLYRNAPRCHRIRCRCIQ